jgi:hypothetical protein
MRNIVLFITLIISGFGVFAQPLVAPSLIELPSSITTNSFLVLVNDGNAAEVKIEIEISGGGLLRSTLVDPGTSFNFNNTSLSANTTYSVRARAINCTTVAGCLDLGPWSNIINSRTLVEIPAAPILKLDNNCARFVSISWEITERASEITNFQVLRSFAGGGYQLVGNFPNSQRNLFDLGIQPGVSTTYVVIAQNSTGQRQSNQVKVDVKAFVPPTPPINVKSSTVNKSDTQLNITWENPEQDFSCGTNIRSSYYVMIKREGETEFKLYEIIYPTASNVIIKGLKPNERVEYSIFALSDRGLFSEHRKGVDNTYGPASKPTNFIGVAFKDAVNNSSIGLSWTHEPKDEDYFIIEVSKDGTNFQVLGKIKDGDNKFKHQPIEEGVGYIYRIKAGNYLFGESDYVLTQPITYAYSAIPNAPYGLKGSVSGTKVDLKWYDDSNKEENYVLERSVDNSTAFAELKKLDRNATTYSDNTVAAGKKYYYRIKAVNSIGSSVYSNIFEASVTSGSGFVNNVEFSIFPNPTLDFVSVKISSDEIRSPINISIFDQNNMEVLNKNYDPRNIKINLENFDSGVYNMIIKTESESISRKIVKY